MNWHTLIFHNSRCVYLFCSFRISQSHKAPFRTPSRPTQCNLFSSDFFSLTLLAVLFQCSYLMMFAMEQYATKFTKEKLRIQVTEWKHFDLFFKLILNGEPSLIGAK